MMSQISAVSTDLHEERDAFNKRRCSNRLENSRVPFPRFLIALLTDIQEEQREKTRWILEQTTDQLLCPHPGIFIADLQGMESYFRESERLFKTLECACQSALPKHETESIRFFSGHHLMRAMIYAQHPFAGRLHILNRDHLGLRHCMRALTWERWLAGLLSFLQLYDVPSSHLQRIFQELLQFSKSMKSMRFSSPEAARSTWTLEEIARRFGTCVAHIWHSFFHSCDLHSFGNARLKRQEEPLNLNNFVVSSQETATFEGQFSLPLSSANTALMECVSLCLRKIHNSSLGLFRTSEATSAGDPHLQMSLLPTLNMRDFEISLQFESGHEFARQIFLNEGITTVNPTTKKVLRLIFDNFLPQKRSQIRTPAPSCLGSHSLKPGLSQKRSEHQEKKIAATSQHFHSSIHLTPQELVSTSSGPAIPDSQEPSIFHLVGQLRSVQIRPLRICQRPPAVFESQLFHEDTTLSSQALSQIKKEILAHDHHLALNHLPIASQSRPYRAQQLFPATHTPPAGFPADSSPHTVHPSPSNLFSHAFLHRPAAVFRKPFLLPRHNPQENRPWDLSQFAKLESISPHDFFLLKINSSQGLWLCSPTSEAHLLATERPWKVLGMFESLHDLPDWIQTS